MLALVSRNMHNFWPWELEDSASPILETGNQAILASAALPHGNTIVVRAHLNEFMYSILLALFSVFSSIQRLKCFMCYFILMRVLILCPVKSLWNMAIV